MRFIREVWRDYWKWQATLHPAHSAAYVAMSNLPPTWRPNPDDPAVVEILRIHADPQSPPATPDGSVGPLGLMWAAWWLRVTMDGRV
ncbi:MAG: hypothetical protein GY851_06625 [bacterium]|nr:hypothetical protein [bacterium]